MAEDLTATKPKRVRFRDPFGNLVEERDGENVVIKARLPGVSDVGLKKAADQPGEALGLDLSDLGISASIPAIDRAEVERTTREQLAPSRKALEERLGRRIGVAREEAVQEERALEATLGTRRRFSSSARAFVSFIDDKNKKEIAELELQRDEALADFDLKLAGLVDAKIAQKKEDQTQEINNILKVLQIAEATQETKAADTITPQSEVDAAILNAWNEGFTEVADVMESASRSGVDITFEDVTAGLQALGENLGLTGKDIASKLTGDAKTAVALLQDAPTLLPESITSLPQSQQLGAVIRWLESDATSGGGTYGGFSGNGIGPGDDAYTRNILVARLGKQIYGTRISDKEGERVEGFITAGMAQGKSEYEIIDDVLGFQVTRNKPLANNLRNMLLANVGEDGLFGADMLGLARLINTGQDAAAIQKAEDIAYQAAKDLDAEAFTSEAATRIATQQVNELIELLDEEGLLEEVGTFQGTITKLLTRRLRGAKETEILNRVQNLVAELRKNFAGVAVTPEEMRQLEPLFPDIDQPAASFMVELNNLKTIPLLKINQVRDERNMPVISEEQLMDRDKRVVLYQQGSDPLEIFAAEEGATEDNPLGI